MSFPSDVPSNTPLSRTVTVRRRVANDPTRYVIDLGDGISGAEIGFYPGPLALVPGQRVRAQWNKDMLAWQLTGPGFTGCEWDEIDSISGIGGRDNILLSSNDAHLIVFDGSTIRTYPFDNTSGTISAEADSQIGGVGGIRFAAISPDNAYIAITGATTPRIEVWNFNNATGLIGAKVTDVSPVPGSTVNGVSWNKAGTFLAVAIASSPFFIVWPWAAGFSPKVADPTLPIGIISGVDVDWHPNDDILAATISVTGGGDIAAAWTWTGQFGSLLGQPASEGAIAALACAFSSDGKHVAYGEDSLTGTVLTNVHVYPFDKVTGFGIEIPHPECGPHNSPQVYQIQWVKNDQWIVHPHQSGEGTRNSAAIWSALSFNGTAFGTCCVGDEDPILFGANAIVVDSTETYLIISGSSGGKDVTSYRISLGVSVPGQGLSISDLLNVSIT